MNKSEFLKYLEKRLAVLNQKEREDIIYEYTQHIEMKIKSGLTEEEAIKDFGDVEELADEILSAYNLDPNYKKSSFDTEKVEETIHTGMGIAKKWFNKIKDRIKGLADSLELYNTESIIKFLIKLVLMVIGLAFVFIILGIILALFLEVLKDFIGLDIGYTIADMFFFGILFCYIIVAIILYIFIIINYMRKKVLIKLDTENYSSNISYNISERNVLNMICKLILWCVRIGVLFTVLPCFLFLPFTIIGLGALIVFMVMGYPVIGLTIGCLGFNMCSIAILAAIVKYVYFTKYNFGEVEDNEI